MENGNDDLKRGDTWRLVASVQDTAGQLEDLAGCTIFLALQADRFAADGTAVLSKRFDIAAGAPNYEPVLVINPADTGIAAGTYWLGMRRVRPGVPTDVLTMEAKQVRVVQTFPQNVAL